MSPRSRRPMHQNGKWSVRLLSVQNVKHRPIHDTQQNVEYRADEGYDDNVRDQVELEHEPILKGNLRDILRENSGDDVVRLKPLKLQIAESGRQYSESKEVAVHEL